MWPYLPFGKNVLILCLVLCMTNELACIGATWQASMESFVEAKKEYTVMQQQRDVAVSEVQRIKEEDQRMLECMQEVRY